MLESRRKTTAEVEQQLELTRKSAAEAQKAFDESLKFLKDIKASADAPNEPKSEKRYGATAAYTQPP